MLQVITLGLQLSAFGNNLRTLNESKTCFGEPIMKELTVSMQKHKGCP